MRGGRPLDVYNMNHNLNHNHQVTSFQLLTQKVEVTYNRTIGNNWGKGEWGHDLKGQDNQLSERQ